ncbi:hypothetical protein B0H19DRAFT_1066097 [Mycena capillaripes]|nr:hypothetical protein B0H19DRAFT_1066097 [Mycena capillaripes]
MYTQLFIDCLGNGLSQFSSNSNRLFHRCFLLADAYLGPQANHLKFVESEEGSTYVDEGEERKGNENAEEDEEQSGADKPKKRGRRRGSWGQSPGVRDDVPEEKASGERQGGWTEATRCQAADRAGHQKYQSRNDIPDISPVNLGALRKMARIDRLLEAGELPYDHSTEWYPGYSRAEELAYNYKHAHPATTDPGGARIALVSEREED